MPSDSKLIIHSMEAPGCVAVHGCRQATAVMGEQRLYASCAAAGSALLATDGGTSPAVRDNFSGVRNSGFCVSRPAFACPEFSQKTVGMGRLHGLRWANKNPAKSLI